MHSIRFKTALYQDDSISIVVGSLSRLVLILLRWRWRRWQSPRSDHSSRDCRKIAHVQLVVHGGLGFRYRVGRTHRGTQCGGCCRDSCGRSCHGGRGGGCYRRRYGRRARANCSGRCRSRTCRRVCRLLLRDGNVVFVFVAVEIVDRVWRRIGHFVTEIVQGGVYWYSHCVLRKWGILHHGRKFGWELGGGWIVVATGAAHWLCHVVTKHSGQLRR